MTVEDYEVLNWLLENVNYLEHHADKEHPGNFWPHDNSDPVYYFEEDKLDMTLREYVKARLKEES